jgi:signal transduction histidine kinase
VVVAFYPWSGFRSTRRRMLIEFGLVAAAASQPLLIIGVMNRWILTSEHLLSILQYTMWAIVWFVVGKGIAWLCREAVSVEKEALAASYEAALGALHTHVDSAIRKIEAGHDLRAVMRQLRELISKRRGQLLMTEQNAGAVNIIQNAVSAYGGQLILASASNVGPLTIPREHAVLFEQAVADLLKNVVDHGSGTVALDFRLVGDMMTLDVRDYGPGLPPGKFAVPGSSTHRLRARLHRHGGDLELLPADPAQQGAMVRLTLPLRPRG